jgi:hypothetical protein
MNILFFYLNFMQRNNQFFLSVIETYKIHRKFAHCRVYLQQILPV